MNKFVETINSHQRQLVFCVNRHADQCDPKQTFSARLAVWEGCIAEVSLLLTSGLMAEGGIAPVPVTEDLMDDPISVYGAQQARTHARYQISDASFLSGLQCFRSGFGDLLSRTSLSSAERIRIQEQLNNFFDRIEHGFSLAWKNRNEIAQPEMPQAVVGD